MKQGVDMFDLTGKVAVVLGGTGVLGNALARGLGAAGAQVAIVGRKRLEEAAARVPGGRARAYYGDVFDRESIETCCAGIIDDFVQVDILVNAVGGNQKCATISPERSFFDVTEDAFRKVVDLNLTNGIVLPCQVFGRRMVKNENGGAIINISSMAAFQPLTRIPAYNAAKAAMTNFTQWLAVHLAQEYGPKLRVNAIAPGFFLTEQNRFLLTDEDSGELTARGGTIVEHTPMGRFGEPNDLIGAAVWLASDAARFVTGIVVPVDGGFSAFSGV